MVGKDLREILGERPEAEGLLHEIEAIKNEAIPLLNRILTIFPEYTPHDISHSEIVLTRINDVIPDNLKGNLKSYEIYFLIVSAYLHDLGMAGLDNANVPEDIKGDKGKLKVYLRDNHHKISEKYIIDNYEKLRISDVQAANIIGRICRGHRKESLDDRSLFDPKQTYKSNIINVPLLASILRVSDELDLTFERIPLIVHEMDLINDTISELEWGKHLSVSGVALDPEDKQILLCTAKCKDPQIDRALKKIEKKINDQLDYLHNNLYHYREYSNDIPWKFILKINAEGYKCPDFKFSLIGNEILKLLIGEGLYVRKEECIRELLKNCVDACRLNALILKEEEASDYSYQPKITFGLTPSRDRLLISDNGIGMDEYIIDKYFTKIGRSFYNSSDFLEKGYNFSPVSELGIGFLSCFLIANKVEIETKNADSDSLLIVIDNISDYFLMKPGSRKQAGTKITLYLKDDSNEIHLREELEHYARHIEIPISVLLPSGDRHIISSVDKRFEPFFKVGDLNSVLYMSYQELKCECFNGIIGILFEKKDGKKELTSVRAHRDERKDIYNKIYPLQETYKQSIKNNGPRFVMTNAVTNAVICSNGILVCVDRVIPEWLDDGIFFQDINIENNALDLNLSRNSIIHNDKFKIVSKLLEEKVIGCFISLFAGSEFENAIERNKFILKMCNVDQIFEISRESMELFKNRHEPLISFFIKYYSFQCFTDEGFDLMSYEKIAVSKKDIRLLGCWKGDCNYIYHILIESSELNLNDLYIMLENHERINSLIMYSLDRFEFVYFSDLFESEYLNDLYVIMPTGIKIIHIKNNSTDRLITHVENGPEGLILNINIKNKFVKLIYDNKDKIYCENENLVNELFRYLKEDPQPNINLVHTKQKAILKWFIDSSLIKDTDLSSYLLTEDDVIARRYPIAIE